MTTPSPDLITTALVRLDQPLGASKDEVIAALAGLVADAGRATSTEGLVADAMAREEKSATGLPGGSRSAPARRSSGRGRRSRSGERGVRRGSTC